MKTLLYWIVIPPLTAGTVLVLCTAAIVIEVGLLPVNIGRRWVDVFHEVIEVFYGEPKDLT